MHWEYRKNSLLDRVTKNQSSYIGAELNMINLSSYLFTHLLDTLDGNSESLKKILSEKTNKLLNLLIFKAPVSGQPYSEYFPLPPLKPSILYKKWNLMNHEEQEGWTREYNKYKARKDLEDKEIAARINRKESRAGPNKGISKKNSNK